MDTVVREGDNAVLDINGSYKTFVTIKPGSKAKLGKAWCLLDPLIGQRYGVQFELAPDGQTIALKTPKEERTEAVSKQWEANGTMDKNNSELLDRGDAHQNLKAQDIEAMKEAGMGGEAIVAALLANSETYESKTHFAQEKYRKRKADKYMAQATLIRPTARALVEAYFARSPEKVQCMRADTLALLLSLANIGANARVLVVETCSGLVTGAVAERLGGTGLVVSAHSGPKAPSQDILRQFNFPPSSKTSMVTASIMALLGCRNQPAAPAAVDAAPVHLSATQPDGGDTAQTAQVTEMADAGIKQAAGATAADVGMQADVAHASGLAAEPEAHTGNAASTANGDALPAAEAAVVEATQRWPDSEKGRHASTSGWEQELPEAVQQACRQGFSCCVLAAPQVQPLALLRKLLPLLAPSAAFAVFSNYLQPLAECMLALQVSKEAVALQLQESWWRESQVLPGRTHPHMMIPATGGYILTGYRVVTPA